MTFSNMVLIGVAIFAILGAIGAFTIAYRRSQADERPDPGEGLSAETLRADRSDRGVSVPARAEPAPEVVVEIPARAEEVAAVPVAGEPERELEPAGVRVVETQRVVEVTPEESGITRRQFFNRALGATFFSFLALFGLESLAFMWPRLSGGFGTDVDAGEISDLRDEVFDATGAVLPVFIPEARAYVVPTSGSESSQFDDSVQAAGLMALFQRCVHLGCRVPWCATSIGFECPCHGSKYNSIGEYFDGPAPRNLDRFVVEERDGRFIIRTSEVIESPRAPDLSVPYPQGPSCIGAVAE